MSDMDALRAKYFEMMLEAAGANLSADERKSSATIIRHKADGTKEYKFPMPDVKHARLALSMINTSDLSQSEKEKVRNRAEKMLESAGMKKSMPPWMKDKEDESKEKEVPGSKADRAEDKAEGEMDDMPMKKGKKMPMKESMGKKKSMMKEANGMVGSKADPTPSTSKKMMKDWEGGGDMGQTGDPKKKPMKAKGKSWLAKGGAPASNPQPPSGDTPVVPD